MSYHICQIASQILHSQHKMICFQNVLRDSLSLSLAETLPPTFSFSEFPLTLGITQLSPALGCICVLNGFSCVWLFAIPWMVACQPPLSIGFSRQEYWRGLPCLQGIFPTQGLNLRLLCLLYWEVGSLPLAPLGKPYLHLVRSTLIHKEASLS